MQLGKTSVQKERLLSGIAPPTPPIRETWSSFFGRKTQHFARMTEFFSMMIMMAAMIIMMIIMVILMIIMTKMTKKTYNYCEV